MFTEDEALALALGLLAARRLGLGADPADRSGAGEDRAGAAARPARTGRRAARDDGARLPRIGRAAGGRDGRRPRRGGATGAPGALALPLREPEETERVIDPYGVVYHAADWYASATAICATSCASSGSTACWRRSRAMTRRRSRRRPTSIASTM